MLRLGLGALHEELRSNFETEEIECLMIVGLWCAFPDHRLRPSIRQAIQVLQFEAAMPDLPMKMPVPMYHVPHAGTFMPQKLLIHSREGSISC